MKKIILKIILLGILILSANVVISNAAVTGTNATIKPGEQATITIKSDKKLGCFQLELTDLGGLEFVTSSGVAGSTGSGSKTITYASSEGTTSMATFTVKAPSNATAKTYSVKFSAIDMDDPQEGGSVPGTASVTSKITVKAEETTPPDSGNQGGNTGGETTPPAQKSSNANLKMIVTEPVDFSGFRSDKTSGYEVTVNNDVDRITFKTTKENDGATLGKWVNKANSDSGYSWVYLAEGRNEISMTVTAEDGTTKKTYTVVVNRLAKEDNEPNNEENNPNEEQKPQEEQKELALEALAIDGITLSPEFKSDVFEYTARLEDLSVKSLKVDAKATIEGATVEVTGNENLVEGENTITVLLKYEDKSATYQITVTKAPKEEEEETTNTLSNTTETAATVDSNKKSGISLPAIIGIGVVGIIAFAALIALIVTKVKFRKQNEGVELNFIDDMQNEDTSGKVRIRQNGEDKIEIEDNDNNDDDKNNRGKGRRGRHF